MESKDRGMVALRCFPGFYRITNTIHRDYREIRWKARSGHRKRKEHYDLRRVKARTKRAEILYIFFGIYTANVVQLADRIEQGARFAAA